MPLKLIGTIILLILVTIFAGVNLDNKCDITFVLYTLKDVPVFMTVIISFAIGAVLMIPFTFGKKKSTKKLVQAPQSAKSQNLNDSEKSKDTESKTLFDFKIKREVKDKAENKEKDKKKGIFAFGKKETKKSEEESPKTEESSDTK